MKKKINPARRRMCFWKNTRTKERNKGNGNVFCSVSF